MPKQLAYTPSRANVTYCERTRLVPRRRKEAQQLCPSIALFEKYGITANYCNDRLVPDSRKRMICDHTLVDNEKVVIVDDLIFSGSNLIERIERLKNLADIKIAAVIVIADFMSIEEGEIKTGTQKVEEKYGTKVYSIITRDDINRAVNNDVIAGREYLI